MVKYSISIVKIPTFKITFGSFLYFENNGTEDNVHKASIAHPPNPFKSARRKLAFLPGKSNAHFI